MNPQNIDKENKYLHRENFKVRVHEIDASQKITLPSIIKLMQETSMQHVIQLKASYWDLESRNLTWVLLRKQVKLLRRPQVHETISILTYPTGFDKFFAYRDYLVFDSNKKMIATAASTWSLIDTNTRKLARVPEDFLHIIAPDDVPRLKKAPTKLKPHDTLASCETHIVGHYDLDWNGHTNNKVLCRWLTQSLLQKGVSEDDIKVASFIFKNECSLGEEISFHLDSAESYSAGMVGDKVICEVHIEKQ